MVAITESQDLITVTRGDGITFKIGPDYIDIEKDGKLFDLFFFDLPAH
ncbi:MAG: hypothetical protein ACQESU_10220 [Halobacteriota archaeon]